MPCGSDPQIAISEPLISNIRRFIKQHRFQLYDDFCLASLPIFVYNGERRAWERAFCGDTSEPGPFIEPKNRGSKRQNYLFEVLIDLRD